MLTIIWARFGTGDGDEQCKMRLDVIHSNVPLTCSQQPHVGDHVHSHFESIELGIVH